MFKLGPGGTRLYDVNAPEQVQAARQQAAPHTGGAPTSQQSSAPTGGTQTTGQQSGNTNASGAGVNAGDRVFNPSMGLHGTVVQVGTGDRQGHYLIKYDGAEKPLWMNTAGMPNNLFKVGPGGQRIDVNQTRPQSQSSLNRTGSPMVGTSTPPVHYTPPQNTAAPNAPPPNTSASTKAPTTSVGNAKAPNAVSAKPGTVVGRAYTESGNAVAEFKVTASGHPVGYAPEGGASYTLGEAFGKAGQYTIKLDGPHLITDVIAFAKVQYDGKDFNIPMYPADGLANGPHAGHFRADGGKGAVRDFILKPAGLKPEYRGTPGVSEFRTDDLYQDAYYGATIDVNISNPDPSGRYGSDIGTSNVGSTITLQLNPAGPLIDGSAAKPITKTFKVQQGTYIYHFYNIPLGVYTATASLNGAALKLNDVAHDYVTSKRISWEPSTGLTNSSARIMNLHLVH